MKITKDTLKQLVTEELKATLDEQTRTHMSTTAIPPSEETLKKLAATPGTPYAAKKANRAIAMAGQHLKQVTKIVAATGTGRKLSGIEGAKAKDQLAQAIEQLQALDAYLENITGESGLYGGDRGPQDAAVRQDVDPRPIRTIRGGTPRK